LTSSRKFSLFLQRVCLTIFAISLAGIPSFADVERMELHTGWKFRALNKDVAAEFQQWHPATVPGVVQTDLLDNHLIPDPFYQDNESRLQWIGLTDWEYITELQVDQATLAREHVELAFAGLDTFAEVFLNDKLVLSANNMFRDWRVACKQYLQIGPNRLRIVFRSPVMKLLPELEKLPYHLLSVNTAQTGAERGIPTDPFTRKAPYHYGWDWGPRFVTMGVWRPVVLESWDGARIRDLHIAQRNITREQARLDVEVEVETAAAQNASIEVRYEGGGLSKTVTVEQELDRGANLVSVPVRIANPKLWFPAGYGGQDRYRFTVTVKAGNTQDSATKLTGLRSIELRREPDQWGKSFTFVINDIPVFAKGVNVIPMDSFLPRITHERRQKLLSAMRAANMNMLRQWGGGAYEDNDFYAICDELGIMVWQEFMFGGAMVPGDTGFQENVRQEAIDNVKRLRDHPSVVIWCGNNEMETGWKNWGDRQYFKSSLPPDVRERIWQDYVVLFRDVLKSVVTTHSPQTPYWPSSPSANFEAPPDNPNDGDMHYWAVWHALEPIQQYTRQTPRFMSEFGFQSFPELATIDTFATKPEHDITSVTMRAHQKNTGGNERILTYMLREYREPKDFDSFVYLSQVQQAEAIRVGAEHFRRLRPRTMGALYWQLNDCWPVASWSSIDYQGRWKALQYYAVRFFADVLVSPFHHDDQIDLFVVNDRLLPVNAVLRQRLMDFSGKVLSDQSKDVALGPQSSTLLDARPDAATLNGADPNAVFVVYELVEAGKLLSRNQVFFNEVRNLSLPKATVKAELTDDGGKKIVMLSSHTIARHVSLTFGNLDAHVSDNYFDLLPNEIVKVTVTGNAPLAELKQAMRVVSLTDAYLAPAMPVTKK
jgi:beta-mannosidase